MRIWHQSFTMNMAEPMADLQKATGIKHSRHGWIRWRRSMARSDIPAQEGTIR